MCSRIAIAGTSDKYCGVDDQGAELLKRVSEAWKQCFIWPYVLRGELGEFGGKRYCGIFALIEGAVDVIRSFVGVVGTTFEGLLAMGPSTKILCCWAGESF